MTDKPKTEYIAVRLPPEIRKILIRQALRERRSLSGQALILIEAGLQAQQAKEPTA